ncbi:hypothetical protein RCL1_003847 [Eukaryota sp. TZLM3-RCL]
MQLPCANDFHVPSSPALSHDSLTAKHKQEVDALNRAFRVLISKVPKTDKKQRKSINTHLENQLAQLSCLHQIELDSSAVSSCNESINSETTAVRPKKRKQKLSEMYENLSSEAEKAAAELGPSLGDLELSSLHEQLSRLSFQMKSVPADGSCLFYSLFNQLSRNNLIPTTVHGIFVDSVGSFRKSLAKELEISWTKYHCFFSSDVFTASHSVNSDEHSSLLSRYQRCLEHDLSFWGGDLEINLTCNLFNVSVEVFQAKTSPIVFNSESTGPFLRICLLRSAFSSGNHYNEVVSC